MGKAQARAPRAKGKERRASQRKPRRSSATRTPVPARSVRHWWNEVVSALIALLAVFLLGSFLSELLLAPAPQLASPEASFSNGNLMGPVGHFLGTILLGFFGLGTIMPVLWLAWLSHYFWTFDREEQRPLPVSGWTAAGLAGLLLFSCSLAALYGGREMGGTVGEAIAEPLRVAVNTMGAGLITGGLLFLSTALALQMTLGELLLATGRAAGRILFFSLVRAPWITFRLVLFFLITGLQALGRLVRGFFAFLWSLLPERAEREEEEVVLPKPKTRRNKIVEAPAEPQSPAREEATHIVVQRQPKPGRSSKAAPRLKRHEVLQETPLADYSSFAPPSLDLLAPGGAAVEAEDDAGLREKSLQIERKLKDFNIDGRVTHVHPGPVITLFEFKPAPGVKVGRIAALQDDLAMSLRATSIRIIAPIPRRGTVGIEVPNKHRQVVRLRDVLESEEFMNDESLLTIPIGKDTYGNPVVADIAEMPHLLMAGATGTGKSVCINAMLLSMLYRASPAELGLILIDPKVLELSVYEDIPHLRVPVVTEAKKAKAVLLWAVNEMERRYRLMQKYGVRNIDGYNAIVRGEVSEEARIEELDPKLEETAGDGDDNENNLEPLVAEQLQPLPKIVIVIDELADLMLTVGREIEDLITRLAQKARASGIHLILATQRPSVDVITGLIKANFPARLSFRVTSRIDSRTILDSMGAERLLGRGDMLFMRPGELHAQRLHGAYVSDEEVKRVTTAIKQSCQPRYDQKILDMCQRVMEEDASGSGGVGEEEEYDAFYDQAVQLVMEKGQASTSMIQRAFRIGYNRAARIIDTMEREGLVGPIDGAKPRQVLVPQEDEV